jgi:hypothetical protein
MASSAIPRVVGVRQAIAEAAGVALCLVVQTPHAWSCDCTPPAGVAEAFAAADAVFSGEVSHIESSQGVDSVLRARFRVDSVWKGPVASSVDVWTNAEGTACGFPFALNVRYIVYARLLADEGTCELPSVFLATDVCTRTRSFDPTEAAALGRPLWTAPPRAFRRGDATGDGRFDISDPVRVLLVLFLGREGPDCGDVLDVNDDGALDLSDAVFALNHLFLGGPEPPLPGARVPGFDLTTDDPFRCGDAAALACASESRSTLPGIRIEVVEGPCRLTLDEAAAGVAFTYRVVVERDLPGVTTQPLGTCQRPGPAGLFVLPRIHGSGRTYCLCDLGFCFDEERRVDLAAGSDADVFTWCGREWFGPSDFMNPVGEPFPPGTYTFEARSAGVWEDAEGVERAFELVAEYEFDLVP